MRGYMELKYLLGKGSSFHENKYSLISEFTTCIVNSDTKYVKVIVHINITIFAPLNKILFDGITNTSIYFSP